MLKKLSPLVLIFTLPVVSGQLDAKLLSTNGDFELGLTVDSALENRKGDVLNDSLGFGLSGTYYILDEWSINLKYKYFSDVGTSIPNQESLDIHRYLINAHYRFLGNNHQTPYLTGGLGYEVFKGEFKRDNSALYTLGLGYQYQISEKISILAEGLYRSSLKNDDTGAILTFSANYRF